MADNRKYSSIDKFTAFASQHLRRAQKNRHTLDVIGRFNFANDAYVAVWTERRSGCTPALPYPPSASTV
jgi:transposase